jgi:hypothetical protein
MHSTHRYKIINLLAEKAAAAAAAAAWRTFPYQAPDRVSYFHMSKQAHKCVHTSHETVLLIQAATTKQKAEGV